MNIILFYVITIIVLAPSAMSEDGGISGDGDGDGDYRYCMYPSEGDPTCQGDRRSCDGNCGYSAGVGCELGPNDPYQEYRCGQVYDGGLDCTWSECIYPCVPKTESRECGLCGTQSRSQNNKCEWGSWSACTGQGVCARGDFEDRACGFGGIESRSCNNVCQWNAWGSCQNEMPHTVPDSGTYYCATDHTFTPDLDSKDERSCVESGFKWTGTLCCSEADDPEEYYNDENGGCWSKQTIWSGELAPNRVNVANLDGTFIGCNLQNQNLLGINDSHTGQKLIHNKELCYQDEKKLFLCAANSSWQPSGGYDLSHQSIAPEEFNVNQDNNMHCCSPTSCWNGTVCVESQKNDALSNPQQGYRCIEGNWKQSYLQHSPTKEFTGYCPDKDQCLVSPFGDSTDNNLQGDNPQCVSSNQYVDNNFCENGTWTSRTKFIALELFDYAKENNDYVIFCDRPHVAIKDMDLYIDSYDLEPLFADIQTNHVCVTVVDESSVIVGTTLDVGLHETSLSTSWDASGCDTVDPFENKYIKCNNEKTLWYNPLIKSIITSDSALDLADDSLFTRFMDFIKSPFREIKEFLSYDDTILDQTMWDDVHRFDQLYISKKNAKSILGTMESNVENNILIVQYTNFETNICSFIDNFNKKIDDVNSEITCEYEENTYIVRLVTNHLSEIDSAEIWNDLTSKLRVSIS